MFLVESQLEAMAVLSGDESITVCIGTVPAVSFSQVIAFDTPSKISCFVRRTRSRCSLRLLCIFTPQITTTTTTMARPSEITTVAPRLPARTAISLTTPGLEVVLGVESLVEVMLSSMFL